MTTREAGQLPPENQNALLDEKANGSHSTQCNVREWKSKWIKFLIMKKNL